MNKNKFRTYKTKVKNSWVFIFLEKFDDKIWNIALVITPSERAARDWYWRRKNRRAASAASGKQSRGLHHLRAAFVLTQRAIREIPAGHSIVSMPTSTRRSAMSQYIQRLGFVPTQADGQQFWVLVTPENSEG